MFSQTHEKSGLKTISLLLCCLFLLIRRAQFAAHQARRFGLQQQYQQQQEHEQGHEHGGHMPLLPPLVSESAAPDGEHRLLPRSASAGSVGGTLVVFGARESGLGGTTGGSSGGGLSVRHGGQRSDEPIMAPILANTLIIIHRSLKKKAKHKILVLNQSDIC